MKEYMVTEKEAGIYKDKYINNTRDHHYPNESIIRLTKWFFKAGYGSKNNGRCLDYGCGSSENMQHLLRCGIDADGVEIATEALDECRQKLGQNPEFNNRWKLFLVKPDDKHLPVDDNHYDYVISNQVLYFLDSLDKIEHVLKEFKRILKPGGKLIITMGSRFNSMCIDATPLGGNVYSWGDHKVYVFKDAQDVRDIFGKYFNIIEVGYMDNYYCNVAGHHWVILAENKE